MSGSGWMAFLDVREWSGGLTGGRESLQNVREWLGGPPACLCVVWRPSR